MQGSRKSFAEQLYTVGIFWEFRGKAAIEITFMIPPPQKPMCLFPHLQFYLHSGCCCVPVPKSLKVKLQYPKTVLLLMRILWFHSSLTCCVLATFLSKRYLKSNAYPVNLLDLSLHVQVSPLLE